ncbi:MAG: hypothetical protein HY815_31530 [Candidatus Riflebacteria bacterium]|nr:hypothetical protein [Candidatus Riflebacteria bacterium]
MSFFEHANPEDAWSVFASPRGPGPGSVAKTAFTIGREKSGALHEVACFTVDSILRMDR